MRRKKGAPPSRPIGSVLTRPCARRTPGSHLTGPEPARIASARAWASSAITNRSAPAGIDGGGACPSRASTNESSGTGSTSRGCGLSTEGSRSAGRTECAAASTRGGAGSSGRRALGSFQLEGRFSVATAGGIGGSGGASATGRPMLPLPLLPPREMGVGGRCTLAA